MKGLPLRAVEVGIFTADGKGTLIGKGTGTTEGSPFEATYSCSYVVNPDGQVPVNCDRTSPATTGTVPVKFLLVLVKRSREAHFVGVPTEGPFEYLRLIGSAVKQ